MKRIIQFSQPASHTPPSLWSWSCDIVRGRVFICARRRRNDACGAFSNTQIHSTPHARIQTNNRTHTPGWRCGCGLTVRPTPASTQCRIITHSTRPSTAYTLDPRADFSSHSNMVTASQPQPAVASSSAAVTATTAHPQRLNARAATSSCRATAANHLQTSAHSTLRTPC